MQIRDEGKKKTALEVYWLTDGVDRCQVVFVPWHLIKHMGKYICVLAQIMDVYSAADDSNYRRQKVYKNNEFVKAVLILACVATKEKEEEMVYATILKEDATTSKDYTEKDTTMSRKKRSAETKKMLHA